jgi:flagellar hook assembly protein FlgD/flagellar motor protein MotB
MFRKFFIFFVVFLTLPLCFAGASPTGADMTPDLYSPVLAGQGAFTTSQGGAPMGAINPAAGGAAQRMVLDAGYLALTAFGGEFKMGNAFGLGGLFPTKFAVFGASLHFLQSPFGVEFPVETTFGGNLTVAKELYPNLNVGLGFNFGFGGPEEWAASGDLGFRYNLGKLGGMNNFTLAFVMKSMGKSWTPTAFTPNLGVAADIITLKGNGNTADPLKISGAFDLGFPGMRNLTGKAGLTVVLAEVAAVSFSTGFNVAEIGAGKGANFFPSIGLSLNFTLKSGDRSEAAGKPLSDGDLGVALALKPLYRDINALGAGLTWTAGVADKAPPVIQITYPETVWISPNNDGNADALEFPLAILDQRYVTEWAFVIRDGNGDAVRTYRNKELRPETQGVQNVIIRLTMVKSGVEIPSSLRWDGVFDSGETAPDGSYFFTVSAADDNGNTITSPAYEVVVDNTPPAVAVEALAEADRIFSPDGDGNKDAMEIRQTGSREDLWGGGIFDGAGNRVKTFELRDAEPETLTWDGTDDEGHIVADGVYSYRISATDRALNTEGGALENIIINTIQPTVSLLIDDAYFSPNGDGVKDTVRLSPNVPVSDGLTGWDIRIQDSDGTVRRTVSGTSGTGETVPAPYGFDGKNDEGALLEEGPYHAQLSVYYRNGYVSSAFSPVFTLDIAPPRASVRTEYAAFSPNNDGNQDEMIFLQEGSNEMSWQGELRRAGAPPEEGPVRSLRFIGLPPARMSWDGLTDTGAIAPDGEYLYQLSATDQAGNTGSSRGVRFTLSTADTPVLLGTDLRAFSPNNDGVRDSIAIIPQLQVRDGVASWKLDILDAGGASVRSFEGQNAVPPSIPWNGRIAGGSAAPDGTYTARIEVRYAMGNQPAALSRPFTLDTAAPQAALSAAFTLFSPNGDGSRDFIPFAVNTPGDDQWEAAVTDPRGNVVRSWNWTGAAPDLVWDGTDRAGNNLPDGTYSLSLSAADEAGTSFRQIISNIVLDARIPRVFLTASAGGIAPRETGDAPVRLGTVLSLKEGLEFWKLELKEDPSGAVIRTFTGDGQAGALPPETLTWDGKDQEGKVREGRYIPVLTVNYTKGDLVTAQAAPITVDVSGPALSFSSRPEFFSPDNDGVDDELIMTMGAQDVSPIASWSFEIREPQPPYLLFYRIEGRGSPAERAVWNGRSNSSRNAELVQAATDYPYTFKAEDVLGNASVLEGMLGVDVLVIRDGDVLRIQVPSIVFRANEADFVGLAPEVVDNNNRILRRIAEILNKFRDYRVQVEGHANPVLQTEKEETEELQPLSEKRARATVEFLAGFGVNRGRLSAIGMGGKRPVTPFADRDNWWKNRRVEFILIK